MANHVQCKNFVLPDSRLDVMQSLFLRAQLGCCVCNLQSTCVIAKLILLDIGGQALFHILASFVLHAFLGQRKGIYACQNATAKKWNAIQKLYFSLLLDLKKHKRNNQCFSC